MSIWAGQGRTPVTLETTQVPSSPSVWILPEPVKLFLATSVALWATPPAPHLAPGPHTSCPF